MGLLDDNYVPPFTPKYRLPRKISEEENLRQLSEIGAEKWDPTPDESDARSSF